MIKIIPLMILISLPLIACDQSPKLTKAPKASFLKLRSAAAPVPEYRKVDGCETHECDMCALDGPISITDEQGNTILIPECPPQEGEGWLCCDSWNTNCIEIDGEPDGTCPEYNYCDYYEINASGNAICWDIFGQG